MITKEEFGIWKNEPITKEVFAKLYEIRGEFSSSLENGATLKGGYGTIEETARVIGILYGIDLILQMEVLDDKSE